MAVTNLGREGSTPPHVRAHDNPTPTVSGVGVSVNAAVGTPKPRPERGRPGLSGLTPPTTLPGLGDFGRKRPGSRSAALRA